MFQRFATSMLIPLAVVLLVPSAGWSKSASLTNSAQALGAEPQFDETIVTIKHPTVIGNFYVMPGSYVATVNEGIMKLHNENQGIVAEAIVNREEANRTFAKTKEDVKRDSLKRLDLGGTREAVQIEKPDFVSS